MVSRFRKEVGVGERALTQRSQFQSGEVDTTASDILKGIGDFMKVGSAVATDYFNNQIAKDTLVQTARAWEGKAPTTEATVAGRNSASIIGLSLATAKAGEHFKALADSDVSDDEFDEGVKGLWDSISSEVKGKYGVSQLSQEALLVEMQKLMPSTMARREGAKIKQDIKTRSGDLRDLYILKAKEETGQPIEDSMLGLISEEGGKRLQLTDEQRDDALIEAIDATLDPLLIEHSKSVVDRNGVSLYDRTGSIQKKERQVKAQEARIDAGTISRNVEELNDQYTSGNLTRDVYEEQVAIMNEATGGVAYTKGQVESIHRKVAKTNVKEMKLDNVKDKVIKSKGEYVDNDLTKKDLQSVVGGIEQDYVEDETQLIATIEDPEKQAVALATSMSRVVRKTIANADKLAITYDKYSNILTSFANVNVDSNVIDEGNIKSFNKQIQEFANTVKAFPPEKYDDYVDNKTKKILNRYNTLLTQGLSSSAALKQAQVSVRNNAPQNAVKLQESSLTVVESLDPYFGFDPVPDSQRAWVTDIVREQLAVHQDPSAEFTIKQVENWASTQLTQADGKVLRGTPDFIASSMGVHKDHISKYHRGAITYLSPTIEAKLGATGLSVDDAWLDINHRTGMATVMLPNMTTDIVFPARDVPKMLKATTKKQKDKADALRKAEKERQSKATTDPDSIYGFKSKFYDYIFGE